ncbi:MAG: hypothetical protein HY814_06005 [Candidatus Riflebacteria bacterium]|nr:hypothetical protein [Candidatus Riflebacteria bacterium]
MLYLVLVLVVLIGSVVLLYEASFRVRDKEARYDADQVLARYLTRGAVETLAYAVELELDEPLPPTVGGHSLRDVLALDAKGLSAILERTTRSSTDHRPLLETLLGEAPFRLIEEMKRAYPKAVLTYQLDVTVSGQPFKGLTDPVQKFVELGLQAHCELGHADATYRNVLTLVVYSELPWVVSRLVAVWPQSAQDELNTVSNSVQGERLGGPHPVVVFNAPEDLDVKDPLFGGQPQPEGRFGAGQLGGSVAELEQKLTQRGASYLGSSSPDHRRILRIASGGPPAGQYFQVYPSPTGQTNYPQAQRLVDQPRLIENFRPPTPGGGPNQRVWIQGAVLGYYRGIDSEALLGVPTPGEDSGEGSGILRPLGTAAHPSAGLLYGNVRAGLAAISDLAVDRDESDADEEAQRAVCRCEPPERESIDPFLRGVQSRDYQEDLVNEAGGLPYRHLLSFNSPGWPPGQVWNLNAPIEPSPGMVHLQLDLQRYRYANLFETWGEYSRVSSHRLALPYNSLMTFASQGAGAAASRLLDVAFGAGDAGLEADVLRAARWPCSDPLHKAIEASAGTLMYLETTGLDPAALDQLVLAAGGQPRYTRATIVCKGEKLFRDSFVDGNALDLEGCEVAVVPEKVGAPSPRLDLGDLRVAPGGGGGILRAPEVTLRSVTNSASGASFAPLVIVANRLVLKGAGPFEACFILEQSLSLEGEEKPVVVKGLVYDLTGRLLAALAKPMAIVWEPRQNPLGLDADQHYRSHLLYGAGSRVGGIGGQLVDFSTYRRPAAQ